MVWLPELVPWKRDSSHNSRAGQPAWRRCSALTYAQYARLSRLAIRVPRSGTCARNHASRGLAALAALQLLEGPRPVLLEQPRQRPIGEQPTPGLARRAVVRFVGSIDNPLNRPAAIRTGVAVAAVHRHAVVKGGDFL